jgi:hypothetical protein
MKKYNKYDIIIIILYVLLLSYIIYKIICSDNKNQKINNKTDIIIDPFTYYANCDCYEIFDIVFKNYNIKREYFNWAYYFSCNLNNSENEINTFEKELKPKKIYLIDGSDLISSKVNLWNLLKEYDDTLDVSIIHTIMPKTYILVDRTDMSEIKEHYDKNSLKRPNHMYILKNLLQQQQGLKLVNTYEGIIYEKHKTHRYQLVQDYLYNPYLIDKHKINLRYYILIVCRNNQIEGYIHENGFLYYTPKEYDPDDIDFDKHITTGYIDRKIYEKNPLTLDDFRIYLDKVEKNSSHLWDKNVNKLMNYVLTAAAKKICKNEKLKHHTRFHIFGADVAPTNDLSAFLMEINKGPDFNAKDERDKKVKISVIEDMFKIIENTDTFKISNIPHRYTRVY